MDTTDLGADLLAAEAYESLVAELALAEIVAVKTAAEEAVGIPDDLSEEAIAALWALLDN